MHFTVFYMLMFQIEALIKDKRVTEALQLASNATKIGYSRAKFHKVQKYGNIEHHKVQRKYAFYGSFVDVCKSSAAGWFRRAE